MRDRCVRKQLLAGAAVASLLGCAGTPKPVDQLADSQAALRSAQELGARQVPSAALELQRAEDNMKQAQDLMAKNDNEKARWQFERAKADADLSIAMVRRQQAQDDAAKAQEQLKAVQQQTQ
ncbi:MAG TPA: DUF4398 domain-containing protein [Anaeromyxobacteraceae bacterium]|nr:DUF4398 domain-containing protein [Anaeromyxobacteraceae bacterium]